MKGADSDKEMEEVVPKATRTKTAGTLREKEYKKGKVLRSVVCRLNRVCADNRLVKEIKCSHEADPDGDVAPRQSPHTALPRARSSIARLWQKKFRPLLRGCGLHTYVAHDRHKKSFSLWDSIQIYRVGRSQAGLRKVANMTGFSELKQALREQLVVNAGVMIREQFRKRLRAYVLIKFGKSGRPEPSRREGQQKAHARRAHPGWRGGEREVESLASNIKNNGLAFYIRLIWEFQSVVEARMEAVPNEKGDSGPASANVEKET
ncbi:hypothetical protein L914_10744 [Phytophthora nicotianae]|uniref:Uncharacterized protein n=2 Tax=Phytophthora nicotianae TaxID=4792 RepID=W2N8A6_PHYNI|nr:hypothetical protein L914_10744 [Phytophthora nicotianae]